MSLQPSIVSPKRKRLVYGLGAFVLVSLITVGVFASNGWLPRTDPMTGKKTGWFGSSIPSAPSTASAPAQPFEKPPNLSKEYVYAGGRTLAVEDGLTSVSPPADLAVWRPSTGTWYVLGGLGSQAVTFNWGLPEDKPVPADFDGDGKTDFSIYRPSAGTWWIWQSSTNQALVITFGAPCQQKLCDFAIPADFDGDGRSDYTVWRSEDHVWIIMKSSDFSVTYVNYGISTDIPVPADFDGDGKTDVALWRDSEGRFYSIDSSTQQERIIQWGLPNDKPVLGDYDGDGKSDHAVFRPSNGYWYIKPSSNPNTQYIWQYGQSGDILVPNDYDGDGKCDMAVWRLTNIGPATYGIWWIKESETNTDRIVNWGIAGDIPVPAFYRR